ncbi:hypothetical protein H1P_230016 [Hyella patelloides LEGE 07179]|uniref:DUF3592 domain-containing protein n=1 Tax=Hyella patelloides LEGE 07179 TaxID=945734 RepID=A0A563VR59_9CYAN|nr:DUF3592 domain-containing protein [Hyella patelloides]VEP13952.1 hypothetical protein H1P_230016 [Hyella patelloides LEGE 07179]
MQIVFLLLGLLAIFHGISTLEQKRRQRKKLTSITTGIVVDNVYKNPYHHDEPSYYRVVEFFTNSPERLVRIECLDFGRNQPHKLEQKVKVCYSPYNPENAELVHNYWWFPGVFVICVGCGFVIFTLFAPIW